MYMTLGMLTNRAGIGPVIASVDFNEDTTAPFQANLPAVSVGDLLVIMMVIGTSGTPNATPSGWTQLVSGVFHGFYKWVTVAAAAAPVTISFAGAADPGFTVLRITGADMAQNPQAAVHVDNDILLPNPPAVDPAWADASNLFIVYAGSSSATTTLTSYPAGYTLYQETNGGAATRSFVAAKLALSSASEDPGVFTLGGTTSALMRTFTIAVKGL